MKYMNKMIKLKEKDIVNLFIIDQDYDGLGISKFDDFLIFVRGAIVGEEVSARIDKMHRNFAEAHVLNVIKKSENRIEARCKYFPECGGCSLLHMKYPFTVHVKKNAFLVTLKKIASIEGKELIDEVIMMDYDKSRLDYYISGFRNKIQMPASINKQGKLIFGYYEKETHNVIDIDYCFSQSEGVNDLIIFIKNICRDYKISSYNENNKKGILRHLLVRENYQGKCMVAFIVNERIDANVLMQIKNKIINKLLL